MAYNAETTLQGGAERTRLQRHSDVLGRVPHVGERKSLGDGFAALELRQESFTKGAGSTGRRQTICKGRRTMQIHAW